MPFRAPYYRVSSLRETVALVTRLRPTGVIVDVEPLVCAWNTDRETLDRGLASVMSALSRAGAGASEPPTIVFATNSRRRPGRLPDRCVYLHRARKPWTTGLPRAATASGRWIVCGDQVLTDGLLAWRLRAAFVHLVDDDVRAPFWPRVQSAAGALFIRVGLFRRATA
jgi:hypothetical protein